MHSYRLLPQGAYAEHYHCVFRYMLMFQFKPAAEANFLSPNGVFAPPRDNPPKCAKDIAASLERLQEPQAATGGINWYR